MKTQEIKKIRKIFADIGKKVQNIESALNEIKNDLEIMVLEADGAIISINQAQKIMSDKQFIGPDDIKNTFGFMPKVIPEIPFSKERLERAKELGQHLILHVNTKEDGTLFTTNDMVETLDNKASDGKALFRNKNQSHNWFTKDSTMANETPRLSWRLTTPEILEGSLGKNYLEQTEVIIDYLQNKVFDGISMPKKYQDAIDEFNALNTDEFKAKIASSYDSIWKPAAKKLVELTINQMTRENNAEAINRLALTERKTGIKCLENLRTWTNSIAENGDLVDVGYFDDGGLFAYAIRSGLSDSILGVCFSCSE